MLARLLMLAACALMIASAVVFRPATTYEDLWRAFILMLLGGAAVGLALRFRYYRGVVETEPAEFSTSLQRLYPIHWFMVIAGTFLLLLLAEINGAALGIAPLERVTTDGQFLILIGGVLLLTLGLGAFRWHPTETDWSAVLIIALLALLALLLRMWQLNLSIPFLVDEMSFLTAIRNLWARDSVKLLMPIEGTAAFPYLFPYWQSKMIEVVGRNFAGLRAASAIIGALTIPALYLLARTLFTRQVALTAAMLLVAFPPHLQFSRLGLNNIADPLFGVLGLAFLARGMVHQRRIDFAAGGAMLGFTHYFYEGGRLLFTTLAIIWLAGWILTQRRTVYIRYLITAGLVLLIVAFPIYYTLIAGDFPVAARLNRENIALTGDYWRELMTSGSLYWHIRSHVLQPFLVYVHQIENGLYYMGETPLLLDFIVPAFLLGLSVVLWRWRLPGSMLLIIWLFSIWLGNSLLTQSALYPRYVVALPALALMAALGICHTAAVILPKCPSFMLLLVTGGLAILLSGAQVAYYFGWHIPTYNHQFRLNWGHRDGEDAVLRSLDFPPHTQVHIISSLPPDAYYTQGLMTFLRDDLELDIVRPEGINRAYLDDLNPDADYAFFVDPDDETLLQSLFAQFDLLGPIMSPFDLNTQDQFVLYYMRR